MKVTIIIGTDQRGCTFRMKEILKSHLLECYPDALFDEFPLPSSAPHFCIGCKKCFSVGEQYCPHADSVQPIWSSILSAQIVVFIYPQYVMRCPGQVKALLDHFGVYWHSHRPNLELRNKKYLIVAQGIGAPAQGAIKDVKNALQWMGASDIRTLGIKLIDGVVWEELPARRKSRIDERLNRLAQRSRSPLRRNNIATRLSFKICQMLQRKLSGGAPPLSLDTRYWIDEGLL